MFGFLEGGQQSDASGVQIGCQSWAPVIAIAQDPTVGSFQDFFCHLQIVDIGWNQADPGNHAWLGDTHMRTQPKKGLSGHLIMSKSGPARDQFADTDFRYTASSRLIRPVCGGYSAYSWRYWN